MRLPPAPASSPRLPRPSVVFNRGPRALSGFTLIELLTVIAIIGVLAAILIPTVSRIKQSTQAATCANNLRQVGIGSQLWAADNKGRMPGTGTLASSGTSANWQDIFNYAVFPAYQNNSVAVLQRSGDTPRPGTMYCPSIERWSSNVTQQNTVRAYVMNAHVNAPAGATDIGSLGPFSAYRPGAMMNTFGSPARTFYVWDSEMVTDVLRVNNAAQLPGTEGRIVWDNSAGDASQHMSPASANNRVYSFRHGDNMNILFLDGHVSKFAADQMGPMNVLSSFRD
jgi:prepilin-type N-terminal cleavage/methylation domain-containing protein/prepilin-type processing-associated H-X9-DG protein